jgi:hypothetical protein
MTRIRGGGGSLSRKERLQFILRRSSGQVQPCDVGIFSEMKANIGPIPQLQTFQSKGSWFSRFPGRYKQHFSTDHYSLLHTGRNPIAALRRARALHLHI